MADLRDLLRQQVPELNDAQPLHRQLDPYYLMREQRDIYHAPLEWKSPEQPWGRPDGPQDPQFDMPSLAGLMDKQGDPPASGALLALLRGA